MQKAILAKDIMVTKLVTVSPEMDVLDAIDKLIDNKISGAPVVDEKKKLLGILSEKDCIRIVIKGAYENFPTTTVANLMWKEVKTVTEDTDLLSVVQIFLKTVYRRLPVTRDGKLVGQISRRDVLKTVQKLLKKAPDRASAFLFLSAVTDRSQAPIK